MAQKWWEKLLGIQEVEVSNPPVVKVDAQPVDINAPRGVRVLRNAARIRRLRQAIADGDLRQSIKDELRRREEAQ